MWRGGRYEPARGETSCPRHRSGAASHGVTAADRAKLRALYPELAGARDPLFAERRAASVCGGGCALMTRALLAVAAIASAGLLSACSQTPSGPEAACVSTTALASVRNTIVADLDQLYVADVGREMDTALLTQIANESTLTIEQPRLTSFDPNTKLAVCTGTLRLRWSEALAAKLAAVDAGLRGGLVEEDGEFTVQPLADGTGDRIEVRRYTYDNFRNALGKTIDRLARPVAAAVPAPAAAESGVDEIIITGSRNPEPGEAPTETPEPD
jgi:hypothetical protein